MSLVNKNLTYLHMWSAYLQKTSTVKVKFVITSDKAQEETGVFRAFIFCQPDGNYQTVAGGNRVSWITGKS